MIEQRNTVFRLIGVKHKDVGRNDATKSNLTERQG